ncbi:hypothetical protein C9374_001829 [Naegleria lovaniensis]|uniref:Uncharacterized protein n=1 Tax=Naegleria lovaniensis TaxID=51637 RepID=A0AA88GW34_NAELO|nr:uncharacterized protein C9374_001829 [Naegleria lovaniensis]KAG2386794.1 hypothetical protein C9374_001829 [Naegleria lovaniensis]
MNNENTASSSPRRISLDETVSVGTLPGSNHSNKTAMKGVTMDIELKSTKTNNTASSPRQQQIHKSSPKQQQQQPSNHHHPRPRSSSLHHHHHHYAQSHAHRNNHHPKTNIYSSTRSTSRSSSPTKGLASVTTAGVVNVSPSSSSTSMMNSNNDSPRIIQSLYLHQLHHNDVGASIVIGNSNPGGEEEEETIMMEDVERQHQAGIREEDSRIHQNVPTHHHYGNRHLHRHHSRHHHAHKHRKHYLHPRHHGKRAVENEHENEEEDDTGDHTTDSQDNISEVSSLALSVMSNTDYAESRNFRFIDDGSNGLENDKRQHFGSVVSFLFAAIGSSVGLGDLVRFPYLVYTFGGGFLIPYCICLVVLGVPLTLLEFSLGTMARRSSILSVSKWNRRACGVGLAMSIFGSLLILSYYNVILSWVCVYFVNLFQASLPWVGAAEEFFNSKVLLKSAGPTTLISNYSSNFFNVNFISIPILLSLIVISFINFFALFKGVNSIKFVVYITVPLPICLLFIYLMRTLLFEVGSSTGLYYFFKPDFNVLLKTEIWLAAVGQVFFSIGVGNGTNLTLSSYLSRKSNIIMASIVVVVANCLIAFISGFTIFSILGVMAHEKFGANASADFDKLFTNDVLSGLGLAFIVYFQAVSYLPVPHFSALLLIITIFSVGIDSAFSCVETVVSAIMDYFSIKWNLKIHRWKYVRKVYMENFQSAEAAVEPSQKEQHNMGSEIISQSPTEHLTAELTFDAADNHDLLHEENIPEMPFSYKLLTNRNVVVFLVCLLGFILGIPFTLSNGYYLIRIVDHYVSNYCLVMMGIAECVVVGYFAYGSKYFENDASDLEETVVISKLQEIISAMNETHDISEKWEEELNRMIDPNDEESSSVIVSQVLNNHSPLGTKIISKCKAMVSHFVVFFKYLFQFPNFLKAFNKFRQSPSQYWKCFFFFSIERFKNHIIANKKKIIEKYAQEEPTDEEPGCLSDNSIVYRCMDQFTHLFLWIWCFLIKYVAPIMLSVMLISTMITETVFRFPFSFSSDSKSSNDEEVVFSLALGWSLVISCLLCMIWFAVFPFVERDSEVFGKRKVDGHCKETAFTLQHHTQVIKKKISKTRRVLNSLLSDEKQIPKRLAS